MLSSTTRIVPYIDPQVTGSISGIIGAGGNTGAVAFSFCFRQLEAKKALVVMGSIIVASSVLSACITIDGHVGTLFQTPNREGGGIGGKQSSSLERSGRDTEMEHVSSRTASISSSVTILPASQDYPAITA